MQRLVALRTPLPLSRLPGRPLVKVRYSVGEIFSLPAAPLLHPDILLFDDRSVTRSPIEKNVVQ